MCAAALEYLALFVSQWTTRSTLQTEHIVAVSLVLAWQTQHESLSETKFLAIDIVLLSLLLRDRLSLPSCLLR